jgi:hypothetical protein
MVSMRLKFTTHVAGTQKLLPFFWITPGTFGGVTAGKAESGTRNSVSDFPFRPGEFVQCSSDGICIDSPNEALGIQL